jgi:hypothetical protein
VSAAEIEGDQGLHVNLEKDRERSPPTRAVDRDGETAEQEVVGRRRPLTGIERDAGRRRRLVRDDDLDRPLEGRQAMATGERSGRQEGLNTVGQIPSKMKRSLGESDAHHAAVGGSETEREG